MKRKPVVPRSIARRDIDDALAHYLREGDARVAEGFVDALQSAFRHMASHPTSGSPLYAHDLELPGLRHWPLQGYPFLVFYIERVDHVDVWRVLHGARDLPAGLSAIVPEED